MEEVEPFSMNNDKSSPMAYIVNEQEYVMGEPEMEITPDCAKPAVSFLTPIRVLNGLLFCVLAVLIFRFPIQFESAKRSFSIDEQKLIQSASQESNMYVVAVLGCSMSSPIRFFLYPLLEEFGIHTMRYGKWEVLVPEKAESFKSKFIASDSVVQALENIWRLSFMKQESTIVKFDRRPAINDPELKALMKRVQPKIVFAERRNMLDRLVCTIRDCFSNQFGHAVYADTGKPAASCFDRRKSGRKVKAYINPGNLTEALSYHKQYTDRFYDQIQNDFSPHREVVRVSTEDLWAFETVGDRQRSLMAWHTLLYGFDIPFLKESLEKRMDEFTEDNGAHPPKTHDMTIYNLDELMERYGDDGRFQYYLRPPKTPPTNGKSKQLKQ